MKSKGDIKREKIYNIYSCNLQWIKSHNKVQIKPDFTEGYLCPICFNLYDKSYLNKNCANPLTLEDTPPKSLGGKPIILTCKKCNSICGYKLDVHLLNRLEEINAFQLLPNSRFRTTFEKNGNKINGSINVDENRKVYLNFRKDWSNPKEEKRFNRDVFPPLIIKNPAFYPEMMFKSQPVINTSKFNIKLPTKSDENKVNIALLKSAYLYAFAKYGYSFIINSGLYKVREQILNPDKEILPKNFCFKYNFSDEALGLNFINEPKELRCYLIVLKLKTKSKDYKFGIALPGPSKPGIEIYKNIENILCQNKDGFEKCEMIHIPDLDYVMTKGSIWLSQYYWQKYCQENPHKE